MDRSAQPPDGKRMISALFCAALVHAAPPPPTLVFSMTLRQGQGYGAKGDGCIAAEEAVKSDPIISKIVFDGVRGRLSQENAALERHPAFNLTNIGRWDMKVPREWDVGSPF